MSKHTPGPWKVITSIREGQDFLEVSDSDGLRVIAECPGTKRIENARLIAAAPEMAEMLLSMYVHVSHGGPTREEAEALLKKAGVL